MTTVQLLLMGIYEKQLVSRPRRSELYLSPLQSMPTIASAFFPSHAWAVFVKCQQQLVLVIPAHAPMQ